MHMYRIFTLTLIPSQSTCTSFALEAASNAALVWHLGLGMRNNYRSLVNLLQLNYFGYGPLPPQLTQPVCHALDSHIHRRLSADTRACHPWSRAVAPIMYSSQAKPRNLSPLDLRRVYIHERNLFRNPVKARKLVLLAASCVPFVRSLF
ncbi:hypothetical protein K438DRAFT_1799645 [Mycena galopus ATCC 62051]|nr:hypothetical protein K438DRAFT_1799645 [Mycena galopus ATCC 62051]